MNFCQVFHLSSQKDFFFLKKKISSHSTSTSISIWGINAGFVKFALQKRKNSWSNKLLLFVQIFFFCYFGCPCQKVWSKKNYRNAFGDFFEMLEVGNFWRLSKFNYGCQVIQSTQLQILPTVPNIISFLYKFWNYLVFNTNVKGNKIIIWAMETEYQLEFNKNVIEFFYSELASTLRFFLLQIFFFSEKKRCVQFDWER